MAITQDRMIALIQAAKAYQSAFNGIEQILGQIAQDLLCGKISVSEAGLQIDSARKMLQPAASHISVIAVEETHFAKVFKKNIVKKEYMRARFGFSPLQQANHLPQPDKIDYQGLLDSYETPSQPQHRPEPEAASPDPYADYFPPGYVPRHLRPEPVFSVNPPGWVPPAREPPARGEPDPEGAEPPAEGEAVF